MTDVPPCLVQNLGSLYKTKGKRNVYYILIATQIQSILLKETPCS